MSSKQVTLKTLAIHSISALSAKVLGNRFMSCGAFTIEAKGMQTKPTRFGQNNESVNCDLKLWNNIPILYFHMAQPFVSYQVFFSSVLHGSPVFFRHPPPKMARCRGLWASDPCTLSADHSTWHTSQINAKQLSQGTGNIRKSISMPCADVEELHSSGYERVLWRKLCLLHCFNHIYIYIYMILNQEVTHRHVKNLQKDWMDLGWNISTSISLQISGDWAPRFPVKLPFFQWGRRFWSVSGIFLKRTNLAHTPLFRPTSHGSPLVRSLQGWDFFRSKNSGLNGLEYGNGELLLSPEGGRHRRHRV